jgi:hypothetical protein
LFSRFGSAVIGNSRVYNAPNCIDWDQSLVVSQCGIASQHHEFILAADHVFLAWLVSRGCLLSIGIFVELAS